MCVNLLVYLVFFCKTGIALDKELSSIQVDFSYSHAKQSIK